VRRDKIRCVTVVAVASLTREESERCQAQRSIAIPTAPKQCLTHTHTTQPKCIGPFSPRECFALCSPLHIPRIQPSTCHTFPTSNHLPVAPSPHPTIYLSHLPTSNHLPVALSPHPTISALHLSLALCTALQLSARLNRVLCPTCARREEGVGPVRFRHLVFSICFFVPSVPHMSAAPHQSRN
jgi:hypothetical protein